MTLVGHGVALAPDVAAAVGVGAAVGELLNED